MQIASPKPPMPPVTIAILLFTTITPHEFNFGFTFDEPSTPAPINNHAPAANWLQEATIDWQRSILVNRCVELLG
jgi:hypothetical protein